MEKNGFIAISTILVIFAVVTTIGISVSLISVSNLQSSFSHFQGSQSQFSVESCVNYALLEINSTNSIGTTVTTPDGDCDITVNSNVGNDWDIDVAGTFNNYSKTINITATRTDTTVLNSWQEI